MTQGKLTDLTGRRYGRLVVVCRRGSVAQRVKGPKPAVAAQWECKCDCGKIVLKTTGQLASARSCGCIATDLRRCATKHRAKRFLDTGSLYHWDVEDL